MPAPNDADQRKPGHPFSAGLIPGTAARGRQARAPGTPPSIPLDVWFVLLALVLFVVGILAPSLIVTEFGNARRLSLLGGIRALWAAGNVFLAMLIFLFTILFPPVKLLLTGAVALPAIPLTCEARQRVRTLVEMLGRWSLLDVLVVAVLVVVVKIQGIVSVEATWGIYAFTGSVLLSLMAAHCVKVEVPVPGPRSRDQSGCDGGAAPPDYQPDLDSDAGGRRLRAALATGLLLALCGMGWFLAAPGGTVERILITRNQAFIDLPRFGNPNYYLSLRTLAGIQTLDTKSGMPIGNGLTWHLAKPLPLPDVIEVELHDHRWIRDKFVDRVIVDGRRATGQTFEFELQGAAGWQRTTAAAMGMIGILVAAGILVCQLQKKR